MQRKMTLTKPSQQSQSESPARFEQVHQEEVEALDSNSFEDFGAASSHTLLNEYVTPQDTEMIFSKLSMPSLTLTKLKVKKSKQAVQDAFSVLNKNMVTIDHSLKDLLFLVRDIAQVLYICFDVRNRHNSSQIEKIKQNVTALDKRFAREDKRTQ